MTRRRRTATITIGAALLAMAGCANSRSQNNQVDASTPTADAPDIPIVDAGPDGPPKNGFGEPCNDRMQCESNLCVLGGPAGVCTQECGSDPCPDGYGCIGVLGVDLDGVVTEVCIPETNQLCSPCQQDSECAAVGMDKCLSYPDGDKYCSRDCTNVACPMGYACENVVINNTNFKQCMPTSAACDCDADNPGATEPCTIMTPLQTACQGQRTCGGATGWGSCEPPSPTDDPDDTYVDSNCDGVDGDIARAIFVSLVGDDTGSCGLTPQDPCATIGFGIVRAGQATRPHVYVQKGTYAETLAMANGISVFGGYDVDWQRGPHSNAANRVIVSGGVTAITFSGITLPTTLDTVIVRSANAAAGLSSVGVRITSSDQVSLRGVQIDPGAGGDGSDGDNGNTGTVGGNGGNGNPGCEDSSGTCGECSWPTGGTAGSSSCGRPGGVGGRPGHGEPTHGDPDIGSSGRTGGSGTSAGNGGGAGGSGGGLHGNGNVGQPGAPGGPGTDGNGGLGFGSFVGTTYLVASGTSGGTGGAGHGGGGGGGGGGGDNFCDSYGSSGGGGGGGGCGGTPGTRGTGGGGSFGIIVSASNVMLHRSVINGGLGGDGGRGGTGGTGGIGGTYGMGGQYGGSDDQDDAGNGNRGGMGGQGGRGGHGGGGGGGPSIGVVCLGATTLTQTSTTLVGGLAGTGGPSTGSPGANGVSVGSQGCN